MATSRLVVLLLAAATPTVVGGCAAGPPPTAPERPMVVVTVPAAEPLPVDPKADAEAEAKPIPRADKPEAADKRRATDEGEGESSSGILAVLGSGSGSLGSSSGAFGSGGLGLKGNGSSAGGVGIGRIGAIGHGSGYGRGSGRSHPSKPRIRVGAPTKTGALPPKVLRRVVRQHFTGYRACYEEALKRRPKIAGRISFKFTIGATGAVISSAIESTSIHDKPFVACLTRTVERMKFPAPADGGIVTISYPFVFSFSASAATPAPSAPHN